MKLIYNSFPFNYEQKELTEEGIFTGYGSIFDDEPDSYGDVIEKGAFTNTLVKQGRNKNGIAMLYQHNHNMPIGVWTEMAEDNIGLRVKGQLAINTTNGKDAYELMKIGAIKGLSIGYTVKREEMDHEKGCRILKEIELWEISPVTFPAKVSATITGIKNIEECLTERDLENALRESGLSKSASQYIVKLCRKELRESAHEDESLKLILDCLKKANENLFKI
jgi:HK97 family phage prohead protease